MDETTAKRCLLSSSGAGPLSLGDDVENTQLELLPRRRKRRSSSNWAYPSLLLSLALNVFLWYSGMQPTATEHRGYISYSPANHAIQYQTQTFHSGFRSDKDSKYQGEPSPALDESWDDLYRFRLVSRLNSDEAAQLPNKTWPIIQEPGFYLGGLDVFHQLHCLNMLRKSLRPDYYKPENWDVETHEDGLLGLTHSDHCIDYLCQAIMCSVDVGVIVWQWNVATARAKPATNVVHTCRDFEAVRSWAYDRRLQGELVLDVDARDDVLAGVSQGR